jgi:hypothetical protein
MKGIVPLIVLLMIVTLKATSQQWENTGVGLDGPVYCFAVYKDQLYAGGKFLTAGGTPAANIARWDGAAWSPLGSGTNDAVYTLFVQGNQLYVGGSFTSCGGTPCTYIARWDSANWTPVGTDLNGSVYAIAEYQQTLFIGGAFSQVGTIVTNHIAEWSGSDWQDVTGGLNDTVYAFTVTPSSELFADLIAGGAFRTPEISKVAWLHPAYQSWRAPEWGGFNAPVFVLANYPGGIVAGGAFTSNSSGSAVNHLALKGTEFYGGTDGDVFALLPNGSDLYVGGSFNTVGKNPGIRASSIAKWNGSSWEALGSGTNKSIRAIALYHEDLYVGGEFDSAGGKKLDHVAFWGGSTGTQVVHERERGEDRNLKNYPNPFNTTTVIEYDIEGARVEGFGMNVKLAVYDMLGREIAVLVDDKKPPGSYKVLYDGSRIASGVYICRITTGTCAQSRRMVLVR